MITLHIGWIIAAVWLIGTVVIFVVCRSEGSGYFDIMPLIAGGFWVIWTLLCIIAFLVFT